MTDDIFRSGVPHAVETNLVTRHAINPRHVFDDVAPSADKGANPEHDTPQPVSDAAPPAPTHPNASWQDNWQGLGKEHVQDNWQGLGRDHVQDNRQAIEGVVLHDNYQSLGAQPSIQEKKLYLEKKSIKDNRQKVVDTAVQRAAPQMPVGAASTVTQSATSAVRPAVATGPLGTAHNTSLTSLPKGSDDDELRTRMQKLKAKVRDVNQTLSDLDPPP